MLAHHTTTEDDCIYGLWEGEIDFNSTLVAGDTDLIADILACHALESWPVHPRDCLASDCDTLSPTNQRALQRTRPRDGLLHKLAGLLRGTVTQPGR